MRPVDAARILGVSTSTLRNYEAVGLVPPAERSGKGYRSYSEVHLAYFECIQAMSPGYGMEITTRAMHSLQAGQAADALWEMSRRQAGLHREKRAAEETLRLLRQQAAGEKPAAAESPPAEWKRIGDISAELGIAASTLRYWERAGLIASTRHPENGYRSYSPSQIRKIWLTHMLRSAIYSADVVRLKQAVRELDPEDAEHAAGIAAEVLSNLDRTAIDLLRGSAALYRLCKVLGLLS